MSKTKYIFLGIILLIVLSFFSIIVLDFRGRPKNLTNKMISNQKEGILFTENIIRYPASVNITKVNTSEINMSQNISTRLGLAPTADDINFGNILLYMRSTRVLTLTNNGKKAAKVKIYAYGNISDMLIYKKERIIEPNSESRIKLMLNATTPGIKKGEIDLVIKSPKYFFVEPFVWLS